MNVAKSPTEQIRELTSDLSVLEERVDILLAELKERKVADEKRREEIAELRQETAELRQENAVLKQQHQDHIKQVELWDNRPLEFDHAAHWYHIVSSLRIDRHSCPEVTHERFRVQ
jgi:hypothetical protein